MPCSCMTRHPANTVPGTLTHKPPQGNDAKCGAACHTIVKGKDFVFTGLCEAVMPCPQTRTNLFLLEDLEDPGRTRNLSDKDLNALRSVADWIDDFRLQA